jgi:acetyl-CoA carboxylase biotin carboxyl carrier protein
LAAGDWNVTQQAAAAQPAGRTFRFAATISRYQGVDVARIEIKSEITGTVWKVLSKPGDTVEAGDTLVIVESMKMEIPVITEDPGKVQEIRVKEKDPVAEGQVVAVLDG